MRQMRFANPAGADFVKKCGKVIIHNFPELVRYCGHSHDI
jgi:hypothetical protein